jgi:NAD(P)-dependent dehydrogenase (short-subunit alcohol dehydrogenase family)
VIDVSQKRVLVTGAGIRLGRAIADGLVDAGASVAFHYQGSAQGALAGVARARARDIPAVALQADLLVDEEARQLPGRAHQELGGLDLLVNSAALFEQTPFEQISTPALDRMLGLGFRAPFLLCQAAAPFLRASQGSIVNLLDIAAERPWTGYAHYCATKAATRMLTLSLAKELAPAIRVNGVEPGMILPPADESDHEKRVARIPLERQGEPEEVAAAVLFLWRNPYLTGVILPVDGGASL